MTVTYRPETREAAAQILWDDAELLDRCADLIAQTHMTADEAAAYLRDLAIRYRQASSAATAGRTEL